MEIHSLAWFLLVLPDHHLEDPQQQRPLLEELTERTHETELLDLEGGDLEYKRLRMHSSPRMQDTGEKEENNNIKQSNGTPSRGQSVSPDIKRKRISESSLEESDEVS